MNRRTLLKGFLALPAFLLAGREVTGAALEQKGDSPLPHVTSGLQSTRFHFGDMGIPTDATITDWTLTSFDSVSGDAYYTSDTEGA